MCSNICVQRFGGRHILRSEFSFRRRSVGRESRGTLLHPLQESPVSPKWSFHEPSIPGIPRDFARSDP